VRESPALDVLSLLLERGAAAAYHDPYVPRLTLPGRTPAAVPVAAHAASASAPAAERDGAAPGGSSRHGGSNGLAGPELSSVDLLPALDRADCVVVCTDHSAYDWADVVARSDLVVDTRNALRDALRDVPGPRAEVVKL
jgi:UDP-N-acetyl-D-glucosamine dehydrogenase